MLLTTRNCLWVVAFADFLCRSPALGAIRCGPRGLSRRGRRSYIEMFPRGDCLWFAGLAFVGAPPSGRLVVVCEAYRDGGVAPTGRDVRL